MLTVQLTIRELPPEADTAQGYNHGPDMPVTTVEASGDTYELALELARSQIPEGWQLLSIDVDRG